MAVAVRTTPEPGDLAETVTATVRRINPSLPVTSMRTMDRIIAESPSVAMRKYPAYLIGAFAMLAVVLAMMGLYGLLAYAVAQRTRELGIRLALGAQRQNLLTMVIGSGIRLALCGVVIGAAGSMFVGRILATMLFQVRPTDTAILAGVAAVSIIVTVLASYIPARRAASLDPMQAVRTE